MQDVTLGQAIWGGIGLALILGHFIEWRIRSAFDRHVELMDMHLRSILDAHYERMAVLVLDETGRRRYGSD